MRLSTTKKLSAVMAGLALSMTLAAPAFGATLGGDTGDATGVATGKDTFLTINKTVVVANVEEGAAKGLKVNYPTMVFDYTVAPATVNGETITDKNGAKVEVKAGPAAGITVSNNGKITISNGTVVLNDNGLEAVTGELKVDLNMDAFTELGAGVYRYMITDATNGTALNANGVARLSGTDDPYYLDVYITNADDGGLEPGGFVLSDDDDDITPEDNDKKSGIDEVPVDPNPGDDPTDPSDNVKLKSDVTLDDITAGDFYETFNATLTKVVTGTMGDKTHAFPFAGVLTNNSLKYQTTLNGAAISNTLTDETDIHTALANGNELKIWGLSPLATVNYTETNDTNSVYKVSIANATKTLTTIDKVAKDKTVDAYAEDQAISNYAVDNNAKAAASDAKATTFTNHLDQISPTGVVMRFAPYVAIMAAGLVLLMFTKSNKAYEEE